MKNNSDESRNKFFESWRKAGPYLGLGTQLAATILLMFFVGKWIDDYFGTIPLFVLICSFLGGFAGIFNFIKAVNQINKKN